MNNIGNKIVLCLSLIILFSSVSLFIFADGVDYKGLPNLSEAELRWIDENMSKTVDIRVNEIGIERINRKMTANNISTYNYNAAVELGDEFITNKEVGLSNANAVISLASENELINNLPDRVDNIDPNEPTCKYFPNVISQVGNSCGAYSGVYYQMTYMNALINDYDVKNDSSKVLSPRFLYNLCNGGDQNGIWPFFAFAAGEKFGCLPKEDFDFNGDPSLYYSELPTEAQIWRKALSNKVKDYGITRFNPINSSTQTPITDIHCSAINIIKTVLNNGAIFSFATDTSYWRYKSTYDEYQNKNINVCYALDEGSDKGKPENERYRGRHAITVVGYDDNIWVDINGNGNKDNGEFGAFKIVNSWGTAAGDNGVFWMSYDALNLVSSLNEPPELESRSLGWLDYSFYWVEMEKDYEPILTAEFEIQTNNRGAFKLSAGTSDTSATDSTDASNYVFFPAYYERGLGNIAFDGTTNNTDATILLDFTPLISINNNEIQRWYLNFENISNADYTLKSFKINEELFNKEYISNNSFPLSNGNKTIWTDMLFQMKKVENNKVWSLDFSEEILKNSFSTEGLVKDNKGRNIPVTVTPVSNKRFKIEPPSQKYTDYNVYILDLRNIKSLGGNDLVENNHIYFTCK